MERGQMRRGRKRNKLKVIKTYHDVFCSFAEPDTPRVIYRDDTEGALFVQDIKALKAHGGGDCPELTFKGILEALFETPLWGSPMYVFTDASPKDATDANIRDVRDLAEDYGVTINFFTTGTIYAVSVLHCVDPSSHYTLHT